MKVVNWGFISRLSQAFLAPSAPSAPSAPVLRGSGSQQTSGPAGRQGGHAMTVGLATAAVALARRRTVVRAEAVVGAGWRWEAGKLSGNRDVSCMFLFPLSWR